MRTMETQLGSLLLLVAAACGSGSDAEALVRQGYARLNSGDAAGGIACFDRALVALAPSDPQYLEASMGRFQALARVEPERVTQELVQQADAEPECFGPEEFRFVAGHLRIAEHHTQAVQLLDVAIQRFDVDEKLLEEMPITEQAAKRVGDDKAVEELRRMGYIGK
jgi:hypothetical protein